MSTHAKTLWIGAATMVAAAGLAWPISAAIRGDDTPATISLDESALRAAAPRIATFTDDEETPESGVEQEATLVPLPGDVEVIDRTDLLGEIGGSIPQGLVLDENLEPVGDPFDAEDAAPPTTSTPASTPGRGEPDGPDGSDVPETPSGADTPTDTVTSPLWYRFLDPCANAPEVCAVLRGHPAIGGTIRLIDNPTPVEIYWTYMSTRTDDGCADFSPSGLQRTFEIAANHPADIHFEWRRDGVRVGAPIEVPLAADAAGWRPVSGVDEWRYCLLTEFPDTPDNAPAMYWLRLEGADGSSDTASGWAINGPDVRLRIFTSIGGDLTAVAPNLGRTVIGAVTLRADEDAPAGCHRATREMWSSYADLDVDMTVGRRRDFTLTTPLWGFGPGDWSSAAFDWLKSTERYGICLYGGTDELVIEVTDSVEVQPSYRELYALRPIHAYGYPETGPWPFGNRWVTVSLEGQPKVWSLSPDNRPEADYGTTSTYIVGEYNAPETVNVVVAFEGRRTRIGISLPSSCTSCYPFGTVYRIPVPIPGPDFTPDTFCHGPRDGCLGVVYMRVEHIEQTPRAPGWRVGPNRRFSPQLGE